MLVAPLTEKYYRPTTRYNNTGKIALCCIAKLENDYIRFFVDYYKNLHFDKIFIYDNNDLDGERIDDVLGDYIQSQQVEIIDYRGRISPQLQAYQDCYDRFNKEYDWIAFFDCDEFLTFVDGTDDIHTFLSQDKYKAFQVIHFNWMVYGDNDMLDNDGRDIIERFKCPILPYDFTANDPNFPENKHVKSIVRGGLHNIKWKWTSHSPVNRYYHCCNSRGLPVNLSSFFQDIDFSVSYLRHYRTRTIGEWVRCKTRRGSAMSMGELGKRKTSIDVFFRFNARTEEKVKYAEALMDELFVNK